jgi:ribosomal protein S18 acetylase RimI-like enzyme
LEGFRIDGKGGTSFLIRVEDAEGDPATLTRILLDIDLQTFNEATFSTYTAAAFLQHGHVFVLKADSGPAAYPRSGSGTSGAQDIIGTATFMRTWERPNEVLLLSMGIRPGWRGRGLGQRFLGGVLDRLRQRGLRAVTLMVGSENRRAVRVYQDVGFTILGTAYDDPRTGESFLSMRLQLQDDPLVAAVPDFNKPERD